MDISCADMGGEAQVDSGNSMFPIVSYTTLNLHSVEEQLKRHTLQYSDRLQASQPACVTSFASLTSEKGIMRLGFAKIMS